MASRLSCRSAQAHCERRPARRCDLLRLHVGARLAYRRPATCGGTTPRRAEGNPMTKTERLILRILHQIMRAQTNPEHKDKEYHATKQEVETLLAEKGTGKST